MSTFVRSQQLDVRQLDNQIDDITPLAISAVALILLVSSSDTSQTENYSSSEVVLIILRCVLAIFLGVDATEGVEMLPEPSYRGSAP